MTKIKGKQQIRYFVKCGKCDRVHDRNTDQIGYTIACGCGALIEVE